MTTVRSSLLQSRQDLLVLYRHALSVLHGQSQVATYLHTHPIAGSLALIAIGKAASAMTSGALSVLGKQITQGLVITKQGYLDNTLLQNDSITCLESAHPIPDDSSLLAGQVLLNFIAQLPPKYPLLCLISGGTSALVDVLVTGVTLTEVQQVNQWLLASGLDIHVMNTIRKSLSCIKGGRLACHLRDHPVINLLMSDVPGDDLQTIGSGLLTPHPPIPMPTQLPNWIQTLTSKALPLASNEDFSKIQQVIITCPKTARLAVRTKAQQLGYPVYIHDELIVGDALVAGQSLVKRLQTLPVGVHVWSSETTVELPENPGEGGRCQSLALSAAIELAHTPSIYLLAAGTDGNDGPQAVAGALVDQDTLRRGQRHGLDPHQCLQQANAGQFLHTSGDLIVTGPTGTNVMDLLIALRCENDIHDSSY